jgi:hypothetical protein
MICSPAFGPIWQPKSMRSPQMGSSLLGKPTPLPSFSKSSGAELSLETSEPFRSQQRCCSSLPDPTHRV